jgi:hypothetical protein
VGAQSDGVQIMMPNEAEIARVMRETGMQRMQVINHLRSRTAAREALAQRRRFNNSNYQGI